MPCDRYVQITGDRDTLRLLLPRLVDIVQHHLRGTRFGIGVDPQDGLLRQGAEGYQLTWMDAKVGDWVVTPRRGKAVEINALWYNALRLLETLAARGRTTPTRHARPPIMRSTRRRSFNDRFWNAAGGYLYDVVDGEHGDDASLRPNQVFAISLPHRGPRCRRAGRRCWGSCASICSRRSACARWRRAIPSTRRATTATCGRATLRIIRARCGRGSSAPCGRLAARHPEDRATAHQFLEGFSQHLSEACIGSISEIFDAEPPYTPRGCVAQAWSVAEVLRCLAKTSGG